VPDGPPPQQTVIPVFRHGDIPLTLKTLKDGLRLDTLSSREIATLQSTPQGYEYWRQLSTANVAFCAALCANDPILIGVRHYINERFGGFDLQALVRVSDWLIAEHELTRERADSISLADLLAKLKGEANTAAPTPAAERLTFDDETLTITLDGERFPFDEGKAYAIYKFLHEKSREQTGIPVTNAEIQRKIKGLNAHNAVPNLIKTLPAPLQDTIVSNNNGK
jgi:hypothetical protein